METTRVSVDEKIDIFAQGDLEHATEILSALWEIVNKDGDIKAPSSIPPATPSHQKKKKPGPPSAVSWSWYWLLPGVLRECSLCITRSYRSSAPLVGPL